MLHYSLYCSKFETTVTTSRRHNGGRRQFAAKWLPRPHSLDALLCTESKLRPRDSVPASAKIAAICELLPDFFIAAAYAHMGSPRPAAKAIMKRLY